MRQRLRNSSPTDGGRRSLLDPQQRDIGACDALVDACFASRDYAEGRAAFMAKRRTHFLGS